MKFCMSCMAQYEDEYHICPHCGFQEGALPADSRCMEPGAILADRYIVGMPQALDSWTVRYIGWDALTEQRVVINEYLPTRYATRDPGKTALTVVRQEPFFRYLSVLLRRARLLAETRLPEAICPVYESFEKNGTAYIITAFTEGQPLSAFIAERAPIGMPEAERLLLPVLRALDKLHENGFITGGFSPENFVVTDSGQLVMRDFIANVFFRVTDNPADIKPDPNDCYYPCERLTPTDAIRLAPENDVYSAAMIFHCLLGVTLPDPELRREVSVKKRRDVLKKPSACGAKLSRSKENALINAAAPVPAVRTSDMETFIKELTSDKEVVIKAKAGKGFPLWAKIAIPAAAVVLIAAAILVIPMLFTKGKAELPLDDKTVVPSLLNLTVDKAEEELQKAALLLEIEGKVIDDSVDENLVLTQSEEEGAMVGVNTPVAVTVSAHSNTFSMPDLTGMRLESCAPILSELGMEYSITKEYSDGVASGCVIAQSVEPSTQVTAGTPLTLTVSKGAEPSADGGNNAGSGYRSGSGSYPAETEDYREQPLSSVMEQAAENHTPVEVVDRVYDDSLPDGTVIEQSPAAGEEAEPEEPVKVVVTTAGSSAILPDLSLMNREVVEFILGYYGAVAEFSEEYSDTVAAGLVIAHDPPEDTEIHSGDVVKLTVSKGREPLVMPDVTGSPADEATEQLRALGIAYSLMYDSDSAKPDATVLHQTVAAGEEVPKGVAVMLTVNAAGGVARVPELVGLEVEDAEKLAQDAGLHLLVFVDRDHPFSEGQVYAQGPASGVFIERGGDVVVFLTGKQEEPDGPPSLTISAHAATIAVGGEFTLEIEAKHIQEMSLVNYELSDPNVAEVVHIDRETLAMTFRGKKQGTTEIAITCGELRETCTLTVE